MDVIHIDPSTPWDELDQYGLPNRPIKSDLMRAHPGSWFFVGTKSYKGGLSRYQKNGFEHAIRKSDGGWDHYLRWPADGGL